MKTTDSDTLHRLVKLDLDTGNAVTLGEALKRFEGYRLGVIIGNSAASNPVQQTALLTIVNTARRAFLGGVTVAGELDAELVVPLRLGRTLKDAVENLGGTCVDRIADTEPVILVGEAKSCHEHPFAISTTFQGWRGGIVPAKSPDRLAEGWGITPAGVLSGALAVYEAFRFVRRDGPAVGHRSINLSLWSPSSDGRPMTELPSELWIGGLGHLGQAFLWTLATLPYSDPAELRLLVQDFDRVTKSSISTSVLMDDTHVGQRKTRAVAEWLEQIGFQTTICERRFDEKMHIGIHDPRVFVACFDNAIARRAIEQPNFEAVVEAGLGANAATFQALRLHTFPGPREATALWPRDRNDGPTTDEQPAYEALRRQGMDTCGVTLLAQKAVGAPFVGCVAAAFMVAETIKLVMGGPIRSVIDLDLRAPRALDSCINKVINPRNPGYVQIHSPLSTLSAS